MPNSRLTCWLLAPLSRVVVQTCQKSQRIGCVIPRCKLQCGITQPILRLFWHICSTPSIARQASLCLNRSYSFEKVRRERPRTSYSHHILNTQPNYLLRSSTSCTWIHVSGLERGNRDSWIPCSRGGKRDCRSSCKLVEFCGWVCKMFKTTNNCPSRLYYLGCPRKHVLAGFFGSSLPHEKHLDHGRISTPSGIM